MRKILLVVVLAFFANVLSAQTLQEVVYLKNGSVIRGVIVEQIPNESLIIRTADGSIFNYKLSEVSKITKEPAIRTDVVGFGDAPVKVDVIEPTCGRFMPRKRGYYGALDFAVYAGLPTSGITMVNGYKANENFSTGFGFGIFVSESGSDYNSYSGVSMFYNLKYSFKNKPITPYLLFNSGVLLLGDYQGMYVEPSFGYSFRLSNNNCLNTSIGMCFGGRHTESYEYYDSYWESYKSRDETKNLASFTFRIGMSF